MINHTLYVLFWPGTRQQRAHYYDISGLSSVSLNYYSFLGASCKFDTSMGEISLHILKDANFHILFGLKEIWVKMEPDVYNIESRMSKSSKHTPPIDTSKHIKYFYLHKGLLQIISSF